jgi:hypothetical protein
MILKYGGVLTHAGRKQVDITSHVQVSVIWLSHYLMNSMDTLPIQLTKMLCVILHFFLVLMVLCIVWLILTLFRVNSTNSHLSVQILSLLNFINIVVISSVIF